MKRIIISFLLTIIGIVPCLKGNGQENVLINLAQLDGLDITPDNILNFQIQSFLKKSTRVSIEGIIHYKDNQERINYQFSMDLEPGMNFISANKVNARFTYSSSAIKELFEQYKKLPSGIYQYCVTIKTDIHSSESQSLTFNECLYHRSADLFLINLVNPNNAEKISTLYPMFSWMVNYPFVSSLSYRIKIVKMKQGQNTETAVRRNRAVFQEDNLLAMSKSYPLYAEPLEKGQFYAWTIDAYYKNLFLGTAEPWKFIIEDDSLLKGIPTDPSFIDITKEESQNTLFVPGILKLKYDLKNRMKDTLNLTLLDSKNKVVQLKESFLVANAGDNRFILNFKDERPLKHLSFYNLIIHTLSGNEYRINFKYVNPIYIAK